MHVRHIVYILHILSLFWGSMSLLWGSHAQFRRKFRVLVSSNTNSAPAPIIAHNESSGGDVGNQVMMAMNDQKPGKKTICTFQICAICRICTTGQKCMIWKILKICKICTLWGIFTICTICTICTRHVTSSRSSLWKAWRPISTMNTHLQRRFCFANNAYNS